MNNATENNNGRFFEYLVTQHLEDNFEVKLTENAKLDQERDSEKEFHINLKTKQLMQDAIPKISSWLESKIVLDKETIVEALDNFKAVYIIKKIKIIEGKTVIILL